MSGISVIAAVHGSAHSVIVPTVFSAGSAMTPQELVVCAGLRLDVDEIFKSLLNDNKFLTKLVRKSKEKIGISRCNIATQTL